MMWEYKRVVLGIDRTMMQDELNEHGDEGWDLVTVLYHNLRWAYIFKRPKVQKVETR
jgi:hypothetical protein